MTLTTELDEPHTDPALCAHRAHTREMPPRTAAYPLVRTNALDGPGRQLINEWEALSRKRATIGTINSWGLFGHAIDQLDDVLVAVGFGGAVDDSDSDHLLWHLVVLAENDLLAARIVLHRVMPALLAVAKRRGAITPGGIDSALGDIIPAAWVVIRTFPTNAAPRRSRQTSFSTASTTRSCGRHACAVLRRCPWHPRCSAARARCRRSWSRMPN